MFSRGRRLFLGGSVMASMFAIRVLLKDLDGDMNGLDALDWRRAHYLSDGSLVKGGYHPGVREIRLDVTEAFARRYFPHDARSVLLTVHPDVTAAGDLKIGDDCRLDWSDNLPDQR